MSFMPPRPAAGTTLRAAHTTPFPFIDSLYDYQRFVGQADGLGQLPQSEAPQRVAIIGAGIAGLTAAFELQKAGVDVVLFEAAVHQDGPLKGQPRLGGRCYSAAFMDDQSQPTGFFAEMGAMRVPPSERVFYHYANRFGVISNGAFPDPGKVQTTLNYRGQNYVWTPDPNDAEYGGLPKLFHKVHDDWVQKILVNMTQPITKDLLADNLVAARAKWQALIDQYEDKSFYQALVEIMTDWIYPNDFELFGALGLGGGGFGPLFGVGFLEILRLMVNELETDQQFIVSGVGSLVDGFYTTPVGGIGIYQGESLESRGVLRAARVTGIEALKTGVRLYLRDSAHETFDACVVATTTRSMQISMGLTQAGAVQTPKGWQTRYPAALDENTIEAIKRLHLMNSSKLFVLTETKFWKTKEWQSQKLPANIQTDLAPWGVYMLDYPTQHGKDYGVVAVSYTWGDDSTKLIGIESPTERLELLKATIATIAPEVADALVPAFGERSIHCIDWETEDLFYGAFKLNAPGQGELVQQAYFQFQQCLSEATAPPIYLAGDSVSWIGGWIEGALHTGLNAATAVLHTLGASFSVPTPLSQDPHAYTYKGLAAFESPFLSTI